jgi:hypothetical protein
MNIISGAQFKDCQNGDFEHYFVKTILLWNLSETKKRLFVCTGLMGQEIQGQYLTRQRELKPRSFNLSTWWQFLDIIPPHGRTFNLGKSAAAWYPSMAKNLKKSYPGSFDTIQSAITFYGVPQAEDVTAQNILASAFSKYYSPLPVPTLREALNLTATAVAAQGDIIANFSSGKIHLRNQVIGVFNKAIKEIKVSTPLAKDILVEIGKVPPEKVQIAS